MSKYFGNIFVVWRKGVGSPRIPIGVLRNNVSEGMRFQYLAKGVEKAQKQGFVLLTSFAEVGKEYRGNALSTFSQRIVKTERNDLEDYFNFWRVDKKYRSDTFYMLAKTQGLLATDNLEFLADFKPVKGLNFISEIASLSHQNLPLDILKVGDNLSYQCEPENDFDKKAVKLFSAGRLVGYDKFIHSRVFCETKQPIAVKVHRIEANGKLKQVFIECSIR
jgi:hypothetical protein